MLTGNVLIAGGTGFVGTNLINRLLSDSDCRIVSTLHKKQPRVFHDRVKYMQCDLQIKEDCDRVTQDIDYVFMCAANTSGAAIMEKTPLCHVTPNVIMNSLLLESAYAARVKKFLFISSSTVYPVTDHPVSEAESSGELFDKYFCVGSMKRFSETMCEMYASKVNPPMQTVVIRPGNIFGEFDDFEWETSHVLPALVRRVVERHDPIKVWGDGKDIKDFIYIQDFLDGMLSAMERLTSFEPINIATGEKHTIREVLEMMLSIDEYTDANVIFDDTKPTMIPVRLIDPSKAKKMLGFMPKTSFYDGLRKTIKWYRENR